jgi:hypothetical protein
MVYRNSSDWTEEYDRRSAAVKIIVEEERRQADLKTARLRDLRQSKSAVTSRSISARNRQMYVEYQSGASLELLARRYHLSPRTVKGILLTEAWLSPLD